MLVRRATAYHKAREAKAAEGAGFKEKAPKEENSGPNGGKEPSKR